MGRESKSDSLCFSSTFSVIHPPNWQPRARNISVTDKIAVQIKRVTPKNGARILEAISSNDKTTPPVMNIRHKNILRECKADINFVSFKKH